MKVGFSTEKEAERHEKEVRAGIREEARRLAAKSKIPETFGEWADRWKETVLKNNTRASSYPSQVGRVNNHLLPLLGDLNLLEMRKSHGEGFKAGLKEKGLKPKTRNHCISMAKQILSDAVDERLIPSNPWHRISLEDTGDQPWDWYQPEEMKRFLRSVRKHSPKWYLEIALGCRAGLRASEVAGLFVEDVNFDTKEIWIKRGVVKQMVQTPKSRRSTRVIRVPSDLLAELKTRSKYALLHPEIDVKDQTGNRHQGHPFCRNKAGRLHRYLSATLSKPIKTAAALAEKVDGKELRRLTHRDLRHTFASHLRLKGVPLEDIRDLLGHHSIQMTLRYAHISAERFTAAAAALESIAM